MATHSPSELLRPCPECGRPMATIELQIVTPPYIVRLCGCERCGISSNERSGAPAVPGAAASYECHRK